MCLPPYSSHYWFMPIAAATKGLRGELRGPALLLSYNKYAGMFEELVVEGSRSDFWEDGRTRVSIESMEDGAL
jgi:hypothetical protein